MDVYSPTFCKFLRLRLYVHQMKSGAYLLLREADGILLRWFVLDTTLSYLTWIDPRDHRAAESISLSDIEDITCPEGGSSVQSAATASPSFVLVTKENKKIDIVASNWREFEVWYQGLVFLTGIGASYSHRLLDVLRSRQQQQQQQQQTDDQHSTFSSTQARRGSSARTAQQQTRRPSVQPSESTRYSETEDSTSLAYEPTASESSSAYGKHISYDELRNRILALEDMVSDQREAINELQDQNEALLVIKSQKDQTIQRLLEDLGQKKTRAANIGPTAADRTSLPNGRAARFASAN